MKKYTLFFIIVAVFAANSSFGQLVTVGGTTRAFLQGNYLEIGMRNIGSFGTNGVPAGYHPYTSGELGEVYDYDHDGWAVGTPAYLGDYTAWGTPYECWALQVNGGWSHAFSSYSLADIMTHGGTSMSGSLTGGITGYSSTGGSARAFWAGTAAGGQLAVNSETRVDANASHVLVTVKLRNVGITPLPGIYYFRSCDPDMGASFSGSGPSTTNTVVYQNDTTHRVLVKAGYGTTASLCLGARDSRAKALWYSSWPLSISTSLASVYSGAPGGTFSYTPGLASISADWAIGLVFNLGTLAAGDSTSFSYAYIFNGEANFDSVFGIPCSGMPSAGITTANTNVACSTTPLNLNLSGTSTSIGLAYQWQSSPDSTTWSNIAGATSLPYTFSGITVTTYYRCVVTCVLSALSANSPGKKITYTTTCPCTGTPTGGTASASTSYCSSCTVSFNVSGASSTVGIGYQWEQSLNGTSWTNIAGATTTSCSYAPTASAYYRCKVTCGVSGLSATSTSVLVITPASIVQDSVRQSPDTACGGQLFFVKASSNSPLLTVKTYFGDGQTSMTTLTAAGTTSYANVGHTYANPGTYTVKQVLYCDVMAMDSITFSYEHHYCKVFSLKFYIDANTNCNKDGTEYFSYTPITVRVDSNSVPVYTVSVTSGLYYRTTAPAGTVYKFTVLPGSLGMVCPSGGAVIHTIVPGVNTYPTEYVGLNCGSSTYYDFADYAILLCGKHFAQATILLSNVGCSYAYPTTAMGISSKYYNPLWHVSQQPAGFIIGSPTITGSNATWSLAAVNATAVTRKMTINFNIGSTYLPIGDTIHSDYLIQPIAGDMVPSNNGCNRVDTVKASFDPNLIEVTPPGCFDNDTTLQFIVHFENLGNDTAHNVYVLDTISSNLDWRSLELLATSDVMNIYPYEDGGYRIVKFDFPGINLMDSSQHGLNDGMFVYKIKTLAGLATGQSIFSRVGIYFDDNEVVMTNTVQNTKGCPVVRVSTIANPRNIVLYPNPATDELTIKTEQGAYTSFTICNTMGQQVMGQDMSSATAKVSVKGLPSGMYYVTLRGVTGSEVRKFVKW